MPPPKPTIMRLVPPTPPAPPAQGDGDEAAIVDAAARGDEAAQGVLFRRHAPRLLQLLQRLLSSTSDAEDALQDSFLVAFRDLPQLRERRAFGGWLRQVAVHQAQRRFRRRRLLRTLGLDRAAADATLERLADRGVSAEVRAELGQIDAVLSRTPAKERTAWMLRYVEGYELEEVAASCGCSLASAKRWIAAAQLRLEARVHGLRGEAHE